MLSITVTVTRVGSDACEVNYGADLKLEGVRKPADPPADLGLTSRRP